MAKRIRERAKEEDLFDEVAMVTVSQTVDELKIQADIGEWLQLKYDDLTNVSTRAVKLRKRLMDAKKKMIILDDVWESLRFEELGIPIESNFERCKVLLTSRSSDTCKRIKNKVVFDLKILEEEEAWIFFKDKAGKCVEESDLDSDLHLVARKVAKECNGLPIALETVGTALQDETSICKWEDSLSQLSRSNPKDFPEVLKNVYNPLKLSYDYLENDRERDLFLMCCLFIEDCYISIRQLTNYCVGLRLFDDITNIKEATNRTSRLVQNLISRSLLIPVVDSWHVKMHDVVRDVAIYIGSRKNHGFLKCLHWPSKENSIDVNCNWMSVNFSKVQMEVPVLSRFPNLRLLMLQILRSNRFSDGSCFHLFCNPKVEMRSLKILTFYGSLDTNISNLWCSQMPNVFNNLEMLYIQYVNVIRSLMSTSVAKNFVSLQVLFIEHCEDMVEVIERDDDNDEQEVDIKCLFPNLRVLNIYAMPKLRRFCEWNGTLEFPLLVHTDIVGCPVMETFILGSINTPKITQFNVDDKQRDDVKDLNDAVRHIWTKRQDKFKIEEEEDEDENN